MGPDASVILILGILDISYNLGESRVPEIGVHSRTSDTFMLL